MNQKCPLCCNTHVRIYQESNYSLCNNCYLLFKDPALFLKAEDEKKRYLLHKNSIDDIAYVNFLLPVVHEVSLRLPPNTKGLDYGSGPQPVLAELLKRKSYHMDIYDPFFAPFLFQKNNTYDFITCTETAEHFYNPALEFEKIFQLLNSNAPLFLMTKLYSNKIDIKKWDYARDPSHVSFYSHETLCWISKKYQRKQITLNDRLFCFEA